MFRRPDYHFDMLAGIDLMDAGRCVQVFHDQLQALNCRTTEDISTVLREIPALTQLPMPLAMKIARIAVTGCKMGAPLAETVSVLGVDEVLARLWAFLMRLNEEKLK